MTPLLLSSIIEAAVIAVLLALLAWQLKSAAVERRELYSRIQAASLQEYATCDAVITQTHQRPKKEREPIEVGEEVELEAPVIEDYSDAAESAARLGRL